MKALVESSRAVRFSIEGREALYSLLVRVLRKPKWLASGFGSGSIIAQVP
jgi:hypothetical protein